MKIELIVGDIAALGVDAIVNAANASLMGGGGVDGAIHRAAGPELLAECRQLRKTQYPSGLPTGGAVITRGYRLRAKHVIHVVGPVYGADPNHSALLADAYKNALELAEQQHLTSIAFPAISTGAYGYPPDEAAEIVAKTMAKFPFRNLTRVVLCFFSEDDKQIAERFFQ